MQDMWQVSCWHEGDNKREQGLALLKKAEEILASKNNNRAKIVATRTQCAATHKMHICRERYNREDPSKLPQTRYCECRLCLVGFLRRRDTSVLQDVLRACHKTCYKRTTRRATSVQQHSVRACNRRATIV